MSSFGEQTDKDVASRNPFACISAVQKEPVLQNVQATDYGYRILHQELTKNLWNNVIKEHENLLNVIIAYIVNPPRVLEVTIFSL